MSGQKPFYAAAGAALRVGFYNGDSLFSPGRPVWSKRVVEDLYHRFVEPPRLEGESFPEMVERKLRGAPDETIQLLAELLFLHLLAPSNMGMLSKKVLLLRVLGVASEPIAFPDKLEAALGGGFANVGRAYVAYRDRQINWLVRVLRAWKELLTRSKQKALENPWAFRDIADSVPILSAYSQRNALLHLAFPTTFEPIVSRTHKQQIVDAFADEIPERSGDVDRDLLILRRHLEAEHKGPVDFYSGDLVKLWRPSKAEPEEEEESTEADLGELPDLVGELAQELFLDGAWLAETVDLLREKKQLVLYGPPGTGKTYLAQRLARFLTTSSGGECQLVQFHPSYSYEDFFEGIRPRLDTDTATVAFALRPGPLKLLARQAAAHPDRTYVLVIDEINRANLAAVFGELYFLLEYRDHGVRLQYSPDEEFRLPANLYLIGTMNTADRSIAHVDAAMRRRFAWQGLFPGESPLEEMLRGWLATHGVPEDRADLLNELNARIGDRDIAVGPSYLMTHKAATEAGLARVWKHHIMPLLADYHTDDGIDLEARYGIDALRAKNRSQAKTTGPVEETGDIPT